jgi:hypothetical protein
LAARQAFCRLLGLGFDQQRSGLGMVAQHLCGRMQRVDVGDDNAQSRLARGEGQAERHRGLARAALRESTAIDFIADLASAPRPIRAPPGRIPITSISLSPRHHPVRITPRGRRRGSPAPSRRRR